MRHLNAIGTIMGRENSVEVIKLYFSIQGVNIQAYAQRWHATTYRVPYTIYRLQRPLSF